MRLHSNLVPLLIAVALIFCSTTSRAEAITADSLRQLTGVEKPKVINSPSDLMDGSAYDKNAVTFTYRGKNYPGILLDDGSIAPAITIRGRKHPACITESGKLVIAKYNQQRKLVCVGDQAANVVISKDEQLTITKATPATSSQPDSPTTEVQTPVAVEQVDQIKKPATTSSNTRKKPTSSTGGRSTKRAARTTKPAVKVFDSGVGEGTNKGIQTFAVKTTGNNYGIPTGTKGLGQISRTMPL